MPPKTNDTAARLLAITPRDWQLEGDLTLTSVAALARNSKQLWRQCPSVVVINLSDVQQVHSAALALLFDWHDHAHRHGCQLYYTQWPPALLRLAALSHVESLIGLCSYPPHSALH